MLQKHTDKRGLEFKKWIFLILHTLIVNGLKQMIHVWFDQETIVLTKTEVVFLYTCPDSEMLPIFGGFTFAVRDPSR